LNKPTYLFEWTLYLFYYSYYCYN